MSVDSEIREDVKLEMDLNEDLSEAIALVLKQYDITGTYIFNVRRDADYGHDPITHIKGKQLKIPVYCMGSGYATVEEPRKVGPI